MLQEVEETTPTIRKLKINIPSAAIEEEFANAYSKLRARAKLPGFRAGKVPQAILEKKFGKDIEKEVVERIVPEYYLKAVKEAQIFPVTYPSIEDKIEIVRHQPLSFTAKVEIKPEIKDLNYDGIALKEKTFTVEEDEVQTAINVFQARRAVLKVSENPIKEDDVAVIDCDAFVDGKKVDELSLKDYPLMLGTPQKMPQEFSDSIKGKKTGESFDANITFDKDYPDKTVADKEVNFKIKVNEVKERVLPPLDDEFAKGFDCKNMEDLNNKLREGIENKKKNQIDSEYKQELMDTLTNSHDFEVPASMVSRELEFLVDEEKQNGLKKGEAVKSDEELRKSLGETAAKNVKGMLIVEEIGKKEKIEITEDEVNKTIDVIAGQHNLQPEEIKKVYIMRDGSLDGLKNRLFTDKVMDFTLSKANIEKK
jgi:trigger factor